MDCFEREFSCARTCAADMAIQNRLCAGHRLRNEPLVLRFELRRLAWPKKVQRNHAALDGTHLWDGAFAVWDRLRLPHRLATCEGAARDVSFGPFVLLRTKSGAGLLQPRCAFYVLLGSSASVTYRVFGFGSPNY